MLRNDDQFNRQIAKLSTVAKLTHARYGTSRLPAAVELRKNDIVVATIAINEAFDGSRFASELLFDRIFWSS